MRLIFTCNAVARNREQIWVLEPREIFKHGDSIIMTQSPSIFKNFDGHVDLAGQHGAVEGPTPAVGEEGFLAEM